MLQIVLSRNGTARLPISAEPHTRVRALPILDRNSAVKMNSSMNTLRIAIPEPTSADHAYNARALPQYIAGLHSAGLTAIVVPLGETPAQVARILAGVHGVLLPGSGFDVEPERYGQQRAEACGPADPARTAVDELLLQDAFNLRKPILAICYGIQSLNVWRNGTLIQDLAAAGKTQVPHRAGRTVHEAHPIEVLPGSRLAALGLPATVPVNSSHHQAVAVPGDNLRVTAISPQDAVIEALELNDPAHFVLGVQWHPERTLTSSPHSRALFAALAHEAEAWRSTAPPSAQR